MKRKEHPASHQKTREEAKNDNFIKFNKSREIKTLQRLQRPFIHNFNYTNKHSGILCNFSSYFRLNIRFSYEIRQSKNECNGR